MFVLCLHCAALSSLQRMGCSQDARQITRWSLATIGWMRHLHLALFSGHLYSEESRVSRMGLGTSLAARLDFLVKPYGNTTVDDSKLLVCFPGALAAIHV
ncbi:hypothetical protein B0O80DRAFT_469229 [Mortierella sp. GBAus27b]|nr:hypothetical protein B0O80DRAFT_469229 [Mortierella sp. GBAus27b]